MSVVDANFLQELEDRGLVDHMTGGDELRAYLAEGSRTLYCGFDPTADSLHIGSLVPLLMLKRFQMAGHRPLALVGGATGLIGDPSFKAQERKLNTADTVADWVGKLKAQVERFIQFDCGGNSALVVNNLDWTAGVDVLSFLRDVGKHFSINNMINKESVKQRLDREGEGISFTEFTYSLLQSFDFSELYHAYDCTLQIGGSDQFGNIIGGVDLTRRRYGGKVFGLTMPLVTKSDGTKFGKTESGTIWLDPRKTSPYAFYQFWLGTSDADVYKFLKFFTFLSVGEIDELERKDIEAAGRPQAQQVLAIEMTRLLHGEEGLAAARRITEALFSGDVEDLGEEDFRQLELDGLPSMSLSEEYAPGGEGLATVLAATPLTTLLVDAGMAASGKQVKDALQRESVWINGKAIGSDGNMSAADLFAQQQSHFGHYFVVKLGKKKHCMLVI